MNCYIVGIDICGWSSKSPIAGGTITLMKIKGLHKSLNIVMLIGLVLQWRILCFPWRKYCLLEKQETKCCCPIKGNGIPHLLAYMGKTTLPRIRFSWDSANEDYYDNQAALHITSNLVFHERTKHIKTGCHFIWEKLLSKEICIELVGSNDQLAYVL